MNIVAPLAVGFLFGWALHRGGMTRFAKVSEVFRFEDLTLLKFLATALAVGALAVQSMRALGYARADMPVNATYLLGNALGGVIVGAGMALAGLCPATVVAGGGEGRLDSLVAGGLGLLSGAMAFGAAYPAIIPRIARVAAVGRVTIPSLFAVDAWLVVILLVEMVALGCYAIERSRGNGAARRSNA